MKRTLFVITWCLIACTASSTYAYGWWDEDDKKEEPHPVEETHPPRKERLPFDEVFLIKWFEKITTGEEETNVRSAIYSMSMSNTKGDYGSAIKTTDPNLNLKIKLHFMGSDTEQPVECTVQHTMSGLMHKSRNIWMCRVAPNKLIYIISFDGCNTVLVIKKPRKHIANAQWAIAY